MADNKAQMDKLGVNEKFFSGAIFTMINDAGEHEHPTLKVTEFTSKDKTLKDDPTTNKKYLLHSLPLKLKGPGDEEPRKYFISMLPNTYRIIPTSFEPKVNDRGQKICYDNLVLKLENERTGQTIDYHIIPCNADKSERRIISAEELNKYFLEAKRSTPTRTPKPEPEPGI